MTRFNRSVFFAPQFAAALAHKDLFLGMEATERQRLESLVTKQRMRRETSG
jgi:hypothetical protein